MAARKVSRSTAKRPKAAAPAARAPQLVAMNPRSEVDEHAVHELVLYGNNDGDVHRQSEIPILTNLKKKIAKGTYDSDLAVKAWGYWADVAAKKYTQEFGDGRGYGIFSAATRREAARQKSQEVEAELRVQGDLQNPWIRDPRPTMREVYDGGAMVGVYTRQGNKTYGFNRFQQTGEAGVGQFLREAGFRHVDQGQALSNPRHECPECGDEIEKGRPRMYGKPVSAYDPERLQWRHAADHEPLCPVMTAKGYQPALYEGGRSNPFFAPPAIQYSTIGALGALMNPGRQTNKCVMLTHPDGLWGCRCRECVHLQNVANDQARHDGALWLENPIEPGTRVGGKRWPMWGAHPDAWGQPHGGVTLSHRDPRAWEGTIGFPGRRPTQVEVDAHLSRLRDMGYDVTDKTPVMWDFGQMYWEREGGDHGIQPYAADLARWEAERAAARSNPYSAPFDVQGEFGPGAARFMADQRHPGKHAYAVQYLQWIRGQRHSRPSAGDHAISETVASRIRQALESVVSPEAISAAWSRSNPGLDPVTVLGQGAAILGAAAAGSLMLDALSNPYVEFRERDLNGDMTRFYAQFDSDHGASLAARYWRDLVGKTGVRTMSRMPRGRHVRELGHPHDNGMTQAAWLRRIEGQVDAGTLAAAAEFAGLENPRAVRARLSQALSGPDAGRIVVTSEFGSPNNLAKINKALVHNGVNVLWEQDGITRAWIGMTDSSSRGQVAAALGRGGVKAI